MRGRPAIALVATTADGVTRTLFFDADTRLLVKHEQTGDAVPEEGFFDDYRRVNGVMEPHRIEWRRGARTLVLDVDRLTHNPPSDARLFDVPATGTDLSPDAGALLSAAQRGEASAGDARAPYVYIQTVTSRDFDQQGGVTRTSRCVFDTFHLGGQRIVRAITRGGEPLSDGERRRQEERIREAVQEYERARCRSGRHAHAGARAGRAPVLLAAALSTEWLPAYVRMSEFTQPRRERVGDRAALVVEFQPRRRVTAARAIEEQIGRMSGVLWIDDASRQVIRVESFFTDSYNGLVPGSAMRMERTLVNGEVWLPHGSTTRFRKSRGFASTMDGESVFQFSDYQKFGVVTDSTIAAARPGPLSSAGRPASWPSRTTSARCRAGPLPRRRSNCYPSPAVPLRGRQFR